MNTETLRALIQRAFGDSPHAPPDPRPQNRGQSVYKVSNAHSEGQGLPPGIGNDPSGRVFSSYFENQYGEQFLTLIDRESKLGVLYSGDFSWDEPVPLAEDQVMGAIILSTLEFSWLSTCWAVATGGKLRQAFDLLGAMKEEARRAAEEN